MRNPDEAKALEAEVARPGERLGRYVVQGTLGAGGMGVVCRAYDERLDREVAIKVLPARLVQDADARTRFELEARALSRLNHPNVATLFDADLDRGVPFLVMELVEGQTLDDRLRTEGPLPAEAVIRIGIELAEGLSAAHEHSVIHRDLKPANLRLTESGRLKVLDFGVAKFLAAGPDSGGLADTQVPGSGEPAASAPEGLEDTHVPSRGTEAGAVVGTLPYLAPELLKGASASVASDVYGAGAVLYELVCGRRAFPQATPGELIAAILGDAAPKPSSFVAVPRELEAIVLRCLSPAPEARFASARELKAALEALTAAAAPKRRARPGKVDSVAVLPFDTGGAGDEAEVLADGLTEGLIAALSEVPGMKRVIARSTVFRFRRSSRPPEEIGRELDVRAVLTGRVRQDPEGLTVSAELLDTADARHLWGGRYTRSRDEVRELPHTLTSDLAAHLKLKLTRRASTRAAQKVDPEAHRTYLRGRHYWNRRPAAGMVDKAIECFEEVIALDPTFPLAHTGLADCYNTLFAWEAGAMAPRVAAPRAKRAATAALKLDPHLAEAHTALAYASLHYDWDPTAAEEGFRRALALNPNHAHAQHWYSHYLIAAGRYREAFEASQRLLELDPLDLINNIHLAWHHCMAHEPDDAIRVCRATLELEPNFHWGHFFLGWALEQLGRQGEAVDALRRSDALSGGSTVMRSALGHAYAVAGDTEAARGVLRNLEQLAQARYISSYERGLIHAALGEVDTAFDWMDKAIEERSGWIPYLGSEFRVDALRADARFGAVVERAGIGFFVAPRRR